MRHEPPIRWAIVSGLALGFAFAAPSSPSAHQLSPPHAVLDHAMAGVRADRLRVPPTSARVAPDPVRGSRFARTPAPISPHRSEEHTSELQSLTNLVCRLLLEKKKTKT